MATPTVRVRFAPSPTGYLHVGGARTALFNYLFARSQGGKFLLRIEDTDQTRFQEDSLHEIFTSLRWLGIEWDEGPEVGGSCGPYVQSERLPLYRDHAQHLLDSGAAYHCFCTTERLEQLRTEREAAGIPQTGYDRLCRHLAPDEVQLRLHAGERSVVRLKVPESGNVTFDDAIRGAITTENSQIDDTVLLKTDGFPTYHLASVVDDHAMQITHVMRGDEWIASTPRHVYLYRAFGWEPPIFAHLPVILSPTGGKLSKRKGAASVMDYQQGGFLPEALVNFLTLLGWNPGDDREIISRHETETLFSFERISAKPAVFDETKLEWMNGQYLALASAVSLLPLVQPQWEQQSWFTQTSEATDTTRLCAIIDLLKVRSRRVTEIVPQSELFFIDPQNYDEKAAKKHFTAAAQPVLQTLLTSLEKLTDRTQAGYHAWLENCATTLEIGAGKINPVVRLALSGSLSGPDLVAILEHLASDTIQKRLTRALNTLS
ncbi:glutamate--tRNA ligase [Chrysiogenes arsenatis]|uniref:glutamate--tRNA ligase n=1 Tax=Chrysiogenes arsenatis TaxID=309797 RepID=UPI00041CC1D6|nr:glutamate--tRNA ligase [Chrysiogenes arsenatis]